MSKLKVLWCSNSALVASGYGVQTDIFTRRMKQAGHDVIIYATFGHRGATLGYNGINIIPAGAETYGNDLFVPYYRDYKPDVMVILYDAWVLYDNVLQAIPVTAYAPIDHEPAPPKVSAKLHKARHVWAMSRHGERAMRRAGLDPFYIPHSVETSVYFPADMDSAREAWKVKPDQFFVVMVANNVGEDDRKNFRRVMKAWSLFLDQHPDALLYIHADAEGERGGINLAEMASYYQIPPGNIRFPTPMKYWRGDFGAERMNALYNAANVVLSPSAGEGFGIVVIEAQSAGCPVIVSDFTAQSELGEVGYKIPIDPTDDVIYNARQGSEQCTPKVSEIVKGLEWAHENRDNIPLRTNARNFARYYDADLVYDKHVEPALQVIAEMDR